MNDSNLMVNTYNLQTQETIYENQGIYKTTTFLATLNNVINNNFHVISHLGS